MPSTAVEAPDSSGRRGIVLAGVIAASITAATVVLLFAFTHEGDPAQKHSLVPVTEAEPEPEPAASRAPAFSTGIAECDVFFVKIERMVACDRAPQELRDIGRKYVEVVRPALSLRMAEPAVAHWRKSCREWGDEMTWRLARIGCRL